MCRRYYRKDSKQKLAVQKQAGHWTACEGRSMKFIRTHAPLYRVDARGASGCHPLRPLRSPEQTPSAAPAQQTLVFTRILCPLRSATSYGPRTPARHRLVQPIVKLVRDDADNPAPPSALSAVRMYGTPGFQLLHPHRRSPMTRLGSHVSHASCRRKEATCPKRVTHLGQTGAYSISRGWESIFLSILENVAGENLFELRCKK